MKGTPGRNIPEALRRYRRGYGKIKWEGERRWMRVKPPPEERIDGTQPKEAKP